MNTDTSAELKRPTDSIRARILGPIMESPESRRSGPGPASEAQLRQPTVGHPLKALVDVNLLKRNPDGRHVWNSIRSEQADRVAGVLNGSQATNLAEGVLERIGTDLSSRFAGVFAPENVERYVHESYALLF